jgi:hypothetical protein
MNTFLGAIVVLFELLGTAAQAILMWLFIDHRKHMGCGEQCAYAAMGLMVMLVASMFVVVPGTLGAVYNVWKAAVRRRNGEDSMASLAFHAMVALMPILLVAFVVLASRPLPIAEETGRKTTEVRSPQDRYLSGIEWAQNEGVTSPDECKSTDAEFLRGCRRVAENNRRRSGLAHASAPSTP